MTGTRDIVVIGCSAGGVDALPRLLQPLPGDLGAALFIAQHMARTDNPYLVEILRRHSRLPVDWAEQGARIERGRVLVAPPDTHLLFTDDHVCLSSGPRENHARPSINKLFRSAAAAHGNRVIGVLLTGMLDDGVAGLVAIRSTGGMVIVQDPADAAFPDLPANAVLALEPDLLLPLAAIPDAIASLVARSPAASRPIPKEVAIEAEIDRVGVVTPPTLTALAKQTSISCPDCHGPTWVLGDETSRRYRCYLGHVNSARGVLDRAALEVESALWSAVRALEDRATTLETLTSDSKRAGREQVATLYADRASETRAHASLVRQFITDVTRG